MPACACPPLQVREKHDPCESAARLLAFARGMLRVSQQVCWQPERNRGAKEALARGVSAEEGTAPMPHWEALTVLCCWRSGTVGAALGEAATAG